MVGKPLLIDLATVRAAGGQVVTVTELADDLRRYAAQNPRMAGSVSRLLWAVENVEGETLIKGSVPGKAVSRPNPIVQGTVRAAQELWDEFTAGKATGAELEANLQRVDRRFERGRRLGRAGRVLSVVGVVVTVYDVARASRRSVRQRSFRPIGAEVIRQVGGWGGAIAGAKISSARGVTWGRTCWQIQSTRTECPLSRNRVRRGSNTRVSLRSGEAGAKDRAKSGWCRHGSRSGAP